MAKKKPRHDPVEYTREPDVYEPGTVISFARGSREEKAFDEWRRELERDELERPSASITVTVP